MNDNLYMDNNRQRSTAMLRNKQVDSLITLAESASSLSAAGAAWHGADVDIMKDAAIVPIISQNFPQYLSAKVRGVGYETAIFAPNIGDPDVTNVWLAGS